MRVNAVARFALGLLVAGVLSATTAAAQFVEAIAGIGLDTTVPGGRVLQPTNSVTNVDWPVQVLVRVRNVVAGTRITATRIAPDGSAIWASTVRFGAPSTLTWAAFILPFPGTPLEEMPGQWKVVLRLDDVVVTEVSLTLRAAERSLLDTLKADVARSEDSFTAHYRLGVAGSMFGEDQLAVTHLARAAQLARRSVYPRIALGRHYLKRGMKKEAAEEFAFAKGLLLGVEDQGTADWLRKVIEDYLQQT